MTKTETKNLKNEIVENTHDLNNISTTVNVPPVFQGHYINNGITGLIMEILKENGAEQTAEMQNTSARSVAIATAMFADDIADAINARFTAGTTRYPLQSIHQYLSVFLGAKGKNVVGKIKLSGKEDKNRKSPKPRNKYFIIIKPAE